MSKPQPKVSVIIPVYKAVEWIRGTLESLGRQSIDAELYEVLVIFNGLDDGSSLEVDKAQEAYPSMRIRRFSTNPPSASAARNVGIREALGDFVTFVDADDWISERYLQVLLTNSDHGTIPVAQIVDVSSSGQHKYFNRYNSLILQRTEPFISPKDFFTPLSFMSSKMYPREWAAEVLFDEDLRSSEDVVFNYQIYAKFNFRFSLLPAALGEMYYRRHTSGSVSRGDGSREFLVEQRLSAMRSLARARGEAPLSKRKLFLQPLKAQLNFIGKYVSRTDRKDRRDIIDAVSGIGVRGLNWSAIQGETNRLVIAVNFSPYADTGAVVTAKRIRERAETVDVISGNLSRLRDKHLDNTLISSPYVRKHKVVEPAFRAFASKAEVSRFLSKGLETYHEWVEQGAKYRDLYSRSMWPHSHLLAGAIKRTVPDLYWEAEFSDPNSLNVVGEKRLHPEVTEDISDYFNDWGTSEQREILDAEPYVLRWSELLPYFFADKLVFTNKHQFKLMLEHAPPEFRTEIERKSIVKVHPTLPGEFYQIKSAAPASRNDRINLAYFGDFYKTRGMIEIFVALEQLPDTELESFSLHIFTSSKLDDVIKHIPLRVQAIVEIHAKLEFLDFLSTLNSFDVLIVNDASTADYFPRNPYLPSKISDYRGVETPIWAVVEPGSILSSMIFEFVSPLGDISAAERVLREIYLELGRSKLDSASTY